MTVTPPAAAVAGIEIEGVGDVELDAVDRGPEPLALFEILAGMARGEEARRRRREERMVYVCRGSMRRLSTGDDVGLEARRRQKALREAQWYEKMNSLTS